MDLTRTLYKKFSVTGGNFEVDTFCFGLTFVKKITKQ